ncbi:MAG: 3'-5' exonuclease [Acetobacterales bacterium]
MPSTNKKAEAQPRLEGTELSWWFGKSRWSAQWRGARTVRSQVHRLLPVAIADVDGNEESRRGTVSVFNGPAPQVDVFDSPEEEAEAVGAWLRRLLGDGVAPHELGIFVRTPALMKRARAAAKAAGAEFVELSDKVEVTEGRIALATMHLAKGLEFRAVAVVACDDEVLPLQERIEAVGDDADLEEVYDTERHLLYVACTRARERLLVSGVDPASEFLDDLHG